MASIKIAELHDAEGKGDQASASVKDAGEKIKDAGKDIKDGFTK